MIGHFFVVQLVLTAFYNPRDLTLFGAVMFVGVKSSTKYTDVLYKMELRKWI